MSEARENNFETLLTITLKQQKIIEQLEQQHKQMLEALIMIYKAWHEDSILISSTKPIIESVTGKKIEEVIK